MCSEPQFSTHEGGRQPDALSGPSGPAGDDPLLGRGGSMVLVFLSVRSGGIANQYISTRTND